MERVKSHTSILFVWSVLCDPSCRLTTGRRKAAGIAERNPVCPTPDVGLTHASLSYFRDSGLSTCWSGERSLSDGVADISTRMTGRKQGRRAAESMLDQCYKSWSIIQSLWIWFWPITSGISFSFDWDNVVDTSLQRNCGTIHFVVVSLYFAVSMVRWILTDLKFRFRCPPPLIKCVIALLYLGFIILWNEINWQFIKPPYNDDVANVVNHLSDGILLLVTISW